MFRKLTLAFLMLGLPVLCGGSLAQARDLTLEDRVAAQEAIERVYYSHQDGAEASFEEAVSKDSLKRKVLRYLKQSAALETYWHRPITAEMLQRELRRMAAGTQMPQRLAEIFDALDRDPILIQECLARATLAARLTRDFHASDSRIHREARREAEAVREALTSGMLDAWERHARRAEVLISSDPDHPRIDTTDGPHRQMLTPSRLADLRSRLPRAVGEIGPVEEQAGAFLVQVLLEESPGNVKVARYRVPKTPWDRWWNKVAPGLDAGTVSAVADAGIEAMQEIERLLGRSSCVDDDTWDNGVLDDLPGSRFGHTAVWTGTEMIVWGGYYDGYLDSGWRYDPAINFWSRISTLGAPTPRDRHAAVWAGTEMLIWGGRESFSGSVNTGGRYDPVSDTWLPMSTVDAPTSRQNPKMIWAGTELIVWGHGETDRRYDPLTDSWTVLSSLNAPTPRSGHSLVWTGTEMIVWGGADDGGWTDTGGRYNPVTDSWTATTTSDAPEGRRYHSAVWTGTEMIVWGADDLWPTPPPASTGGRYDPATDSWTAVSMVDAPSFREKHAAFWTGSEMVVWGGIYDDPDPYQWEYPLNTGGRYDPSSDSWTATSMDGAPLEREGPTVTWTGTEMIVWGGDGDTNPSRRYDPLYDSWATASPAPDPRSDHTTVWTGSHMVIWGGGYGWNTGGRYDPATDSWSHTSTVGAPLPRRYHTAIWTGSRMVVWGGVWYGEDWYSEDTNTGGRYDPLNDVWTATSTEGAPDPLTNHLAVWTGTEMVVWEGISHEGGRYDPLSDSWKPMSSAGTSTYGSTAVWTGDRMLVWGGTQSGVGYVNTGALYDPLSDTWNTTSTAGAPAPRTRHTAVWTGERMLIWGGQDGGYLNTGGAYDPATDGWTALSTVDAPTARQFHTAVWTGSRMVVWGGEGWEARKTGGRYDPLADSWTATSLVGAPPARVRHSAVWTGSYMLIWGGYGERYELDSGGRYALGHSTDDDADGYSECEGDCNDGTPLVYPWAPEVCDGYDNQCPGEFGQGHVDVGCNSDGDGYCADTMVTIGFPASCPHGGGDCNDVNLYVYPDAPEVIDGIDNQCPGDLGYGVIDETSGNCGFNNPNDETEYSWPAQAGATQYEVVRCGRPDFHSGCTFVATSETAIPTDAPQPGQTHYYLVRPIAPRQGSWGQDSSRHERFPPCAGGTTVIKFQPEEAQLPAWHAKDWGRQFDADLGYGWSHVMTGNTRDREQLEQQQLDTLIFSHVVRQWNLGLPLGTYEVRFVSGDAAFPQGRSGWWSRGSRRWKGSACPPGCSAEPRSAPTSSTES